MRDLSSAHKDYIPGAGRGLESRLPRGLIDNEHLIACQEETGIYGLPSPVSPVHIDSLKVDSKSALEPGGNHKVQGLLLSMSSSNPAQRVPLESRENRRI